MNSSDEVPSTPDFERRLLRLVDEALQRSPDARAAYLAGACAGDEAMRRAADALVARCGDVEAGDDFLTGTAATYAAPLLRSVEGSELDAAAAGTAAVARALADRYRFLREIGRGGHATVHLAQDLRLGRDVAIKVMRLEHVDPILPRRFLTEIAIVAQLRHPYIVPLIESGEADGVAYYVMPFIHGESLRQRLDREGPLSLGDALAVAQDVAEALDFAHQSGVVHRDIKPENILLSGSHALVADFGVALAYEGVGADRMTARGIAVGTPAYMSPEQADGSGRIDPRSDIYSLACVIYEMLAGEVPFPGETTRAILAKQMQAPIPALAILRPAVGRGVQLAVERGLAKVPAERPATATALVDALRAPSAAYPRPPAPGRRSGGRGTGRAALLLGIVLLAVVLWRVTRPRSDAPDSPEATPDRRRIAVLYFDNLSADEDVRLIARGLTEDLIDELGGVRGLRVISPEGVRPFRERAAPVDSIARVLGVGTVVGGSVSASDTVVRVTVRMVDPATGEQLRSRSIDLPRTSVLDFRRAVFADVAAFLRERLGEEIRLERRRAETKSLAAWEAVKRADGLVADGVEASLHAREADAAEFFLRADSLYAAAERLDRTWVTPTISRGWVALRFALSPPALVPFAVSARDTISPAIRMPLRAIAFAEQALAASAGSAEALALRGYARQWLGNWPGVGGADTLIRRAEADLQAALDLRPDDARSWAALGTIQLDDGRFAGASAALHRAYEADAYLSEVRDVVTQLFFASLNLGQFTEADRWCALGRSRFSGDPRFANCRIIYLGWAGARPVEVGDAWQELRRIERTDSSRIFASQWGFLRVMIAATAARAGLGDSARAILRQVRLGLATDPTRTRFAEGEAYVHLLLGDRATATAVLRERVRRDPAARRSILASPWFSSLLTDTTFAREIAPAPASQQ